MTTEPTTATLDMSAHYAVDGHRGIAFYLVGYAVEEPEGCQGHPTTSGAIGDVLYCDGSCEERGSEGAEDRDNVIAVMVGDDREHVVPVEDLTLIADDDYCGSCGQVGCTHDGRVR